MTTDPLPPGPGVYCLIHTPTAREYIGSAVRLRRRVRRHEKELNEGCHCNEHLQRAWNKYGVDQFDCATLELVANPKDLIAREQHYIDTRQPAFNICPKAGSALGVKRRPETVERLRLVHLGRKRSAEVRANLSRARRLRPPMSEESRRKLSASLAAYYQTPKGRQEAIERGNRHKGKPRPLGVKNKVSNSHRNTYQLHPEKRAEDAREYFRWRNAKLNRNQLQLFPLPPS